MKFNVSGPSGTTGYVDVYIAKTLIENIEDVEVKLNDEEIWGASSKKRGLG